MVRRGEVVWGGGVGQRGSVQSSQITQSGSIKGVFISLDFF